MELILHLQQPPHKGKAGVVQMHVLSITHGAAAHLCEITRAYPVQLVHPYDHTTCCKDNERHSAIAQQCRETVTLAGMPSMQALAHQVMITAAENLGVDMTASSTTSPAV